MEFEVIFHRCFLGIILLFLFLGSTACGAVTPVPATILTMTPTKTAVLATNTPTDLNFLDERTQFLFGEPASHVIDFFLEIQDCVRTDNKEKLANLVLYPITIHSIDGKEVEIQNANQFIANYEKIATTKWKSVILAQESTKLFANWEGVMINRGEMWFGPLCIETCEKMNYYILSITNETPW